MEQHQSAKRFAAIADGLLADNDDIQSKAAEDAMVAMFVDREPLEHLLLPLRHRSTTVEQGNSVCEPTSIDFFLHLTVVGQAAFDFAALPDARLARLVHRFTQLDPLAVSRAYAESFARIVVLPKVKLRVSAVYDTAVTFNNNDGATRDHTAHVNAIVVLA